MKILYRKLAKLPLWAAGGLLCGALVKRAVKKPVKDILTKGYNDNLWTFVSSLKRAGVRRVIENSLRTEYGTLIERPFGTAKDTPAMDHLMFNFAQLATFPTPETTPVDMTVTIGKNAVKPLRLSMPVMIAGMAYGKALPRQVKFALAKGASLAGTAYCTGEGGLLPGDRRAARQLILQYNRGFWSKSDRDIQSADAIEFQFGQGATGGTMHFLPAKDLDRELRRYYGVAKGQDLVAHARIPGIDSQEDLIEIVKTLKEKTGGVPIGAKLAAGDDLEGDLDVCLCASIDYVALDGAEAATRGAAPTLLDDFGVPTMAAVVRAVNHLNARGQRDKLDIVLSGKLMTPGDFLKALALGADAVNIGSAALFAAVHQYMLKAIPFEPPGKAVWYGGKYNKGFDGRQGALNVFRFLSSCKKEMEAAVRAIGKTSVHALDRNDLCATDPYVSEITGVKPSHVPKKGWV